ncbi:cell death protein 3-like protein [Leptotrombidium deliense]|uniref:Cell death protein 3-like protein n=1 Tax=Leptotrombidium deliense TaxID=299467 RepID=A0A443SWQ6_9ACAR|nr:cell death protein 3-like protein [Leptotrombidium deliense]
MTANPRGYCLLINNVDFEKDHHKQRLHSSDDANKLQETFQWLGFIVKREDNLTAEQMVAFLRKYAKSKDELKSHDAIVVIILTHGYDSDHLFGVDGNMIKTPDILTFFNNKNCEPLRSKPKIFLIEGCRGVFYQKNQTDGRRSSIQIGDIRKLPQRVTGLRIPKEPTFQDMLISYSTAPECDSNYEFDGAWYCTELCDRLKADASSKHIQEILDDVYVSVYKKETPEGYHQYPCYENRGFVKKLYFNPEYYI